MPLLCKIITLSKQHPPLLCQWFFLKLFNIACKLTFHLLLIWLCLFLLDRQSNRDANVIGLIFLFNVLFTRLMKLVQLFLLLFTEMHFLLIKLIIWCKMVHDLILFARKLYGCECCNFKVFLKHVEVIFVVLLETIFNDAISTVR